MSKVETLYTNPLGFLRDCHRRIERSLYAIITIKRIAQQNALNEDQKEALQCALRYLREFAPNHHNDEEQSIFPRLGSGLRPRIERLMKQHGLMRQLQDALAVLTERWIWQDYLSDEDAANLTEILSRLSSLSARHSREEEKYIYPEVAKLGMEFKTISSEMAHRRRLG